MQRIGKREPMAEDSIATEEGEAQLGATSCNKTPGVTIHSEVTEEEGKHQEGTANHMERMEGHCKDQGSQEEVKAGLTDTRIVK